jgi:hypothetical protein
MVKSLPSRRVCTVALVVVGTIVAIAIFVPSTSFQLAGRVTSPDGSTEATLIAMEAKEARGYKVCFRRPSARPLNMKRCTEVAYVRVLAANGESEPVTLIWRSPSQLEIRYTPAVAVHVYTPVFAWGALRELGASAGYGNRLPEIFVRAVPIGESAGITK